MSRTAEEIALDEKIARIRKENERIIKRKQIIDEEIKKAEQNNAIVNVKQSFIDEDHDTPSLYSDSVSTRQQTTVVYPKMEAYRAGKSDKQRGKEDAAWRREREQIDNERIRRQKAASGWRREWDANKTFEIVDEPSSRRTQREASQGTQGRRSRETDGSDWDAKRDTGYRSLEEKSCNNDDKLATNFRSQERKFSNNRDFQCDDDFQSGTKNAVEPRKFPREERVIKKIAYPSRTIVNQAESTSVNSGRTSGPLNQNKTVKIKENDAPNIVVNKVTKFSETKVQKPITPPPWKSDYSNSLSERLKNIVIHVKNDNVENNRTVELVEKSSTNIGQKNVFNDAQSKNSAFKDRSQDHESVKAGNERKSEASSPAFNFASSATRPSTVFSFGDAGSSLGLFTGNQLASVLADNRSSSAEATNTSISPVSILKKSPKDSLTEQSPTDHVKPKKSVVIQYQSKSSRTSAKKSVVLEEETLDGDDDEWEDVSDDEWEDVSD